MTPVIDSHQHFWCYSPDQYAWIGDGMDVLRRDFLPSDLNREMRNASVDGSIAVQAVQTINETKWLLDLADKQPSIFAVVGWVPLIDAHVGRHLEQLMPHLKLKGCRHVLQDEADDNYILRPDFNAGIDTLTQLGLVYDILIFEKHLPQTIQFVDRHPNQTFVLDHIAKPKIQHGSFEPWRAHITELARRPNLYCKVSGLVTEAKWDSWTADTLRPYFETVLEAFTPKRLMYGSDWPVLLLASQYSHWVDVVRGATSSLSESERNRFWGATAIEAYGLIIE
jgi:L-fuconolactonase